MAATDNEITVELRLTEDSNGDQYEYHELWMAAGQDNNEDDFDQVTQYDGVSLQHTVTFALNGITTGKIYSFKFRAKNSKGYSDFSNILDVAAVDPPDQLYQPTVNYELSGIDSLLIEWSRVTDQAAPGGLITGYSLHMDDGYGGRFTEVFNSVESAPLITDYLVTDVTLSLTYRFYVIAYNFNSDAQVGGNAVNMIIYCWKST